MKYIIVDTDVQNGIELMKILDGYEMLEFQGSYTTFRWAEINCREHPPDIAFIRIGRAELNSIRLASVIRKQNPLAKVIFIGSQREDAVEAFEWEVYGFLLAPFSKNQISRLLNQILEKVK